MDPSTEKEMEKIAEFVSRVNDEIESVLEKDRTVEDLEGAKTLTAELVDQYEAFVKRLKPEEKQEVQQKIGPMIEKIKVKQTKLKEAPE